ncbi:major facilitator superfamily domain-containing protein [Cyathus striatus]|nr:major facilitator superfamily domain-containing protein [Cyathus striatus]
MSSLLRSTIIGAYQNTLRGRRRSSIHPLEAVPRLFSGFPEGSAISDDSGAPEVHHTVLTAPSSVHMSDYATKITIPRHFNSSPAIDRTEISSPSSATSPTIACNSKTLLSPPASTVSGIPVVERVQWRLASGYFAYFMCGWGDAITATVLPHFVETFRLNFVTSSLLFAASTVGFVIGTFLVERILKFFGRISLNQSTNSPVEPYFSVPSRRAAKRGRGNYIGFSFLQSRYVGLLVASILHGSFFLLMGTKANVAILFLAYVVAAFARSIITASLNRFFSSTKPGALGYGFGLWSFGGVVSPLVCQSLISAGIPWFKFYYGSLILAAMNTTFLAMSFKPTIGEYIWENQNRSCHAENVGATLDRKTNTAMYSSSKTDVVPTKPRNTLGLALRTPFQWAFSIFAFLYCGCETATQGYMVTYLLDTRNADPRTAGYVTSGFWGGITLGRFAWGYYTTRFTFVQRKYVVQICLVITLVMELLIWFIDSAMANAIFASIIGVACGPVFPACLGIAIDVLPSEIHMVTMALISSASSFGGALFPFIVGTLSSSMGIRTLPYVTVPLAASLVCLWTAFPSRTPSRKSSE